MHHDHRAHTAESIVAALRPPTPPHRDSTPLPVPTIHDQYRHCPTAYALARIDTSGRIADRTTPRALGWRPGDTLTTTVTDDDTVVAVRRHPDGDIQISPKGYLVLPAPVRHRIALHAGDPVFLAALPHHDLLVIHTLSYLDTVIALPGPP